MNHAQGRSRIVRALSVVPGAALALLPSASCPACWGAYGALLASVGLGFFINERVLAPLIVGALAVGILGIAWTTKTHRRYGPLVLTVVGSAAIAAGRLVWDVPPLVYGGGALVLGASIWNLWLKRPAPAPLVSIGITRGETSWQRE
jgi:mercuric ion transport protein